MTTDQLAKRFRYITEALLNGNNLAELRALESYLTYTNDPPQCLRDYAAGKIPELDYRELYGFPGDDS